MANGWIFVNHGDIQYAVDLTEDIVQPEVEQHHVRQSIVKLAQEKAGIVPSTLSTIAVRESHAVRPRKHFRRPASQ